MFDVVVGVGGGAVMAEFVIEWCIQPACCDHGDRCYRFFVLRCLAVFGCTVCVFHYCAIHPPPGVSAFLVFSNLSVFGPNTSAFSSLRALIGLQANALSIFHRFGDFVHSLARAGEVLPDF